MWKCINDYFGYCQGEPNWIKKPTSLMHGIGPNEVITGSVIGGKCRSNPKTCPKHQTHTEHHDQYVTEHPGRVPEPKKKK